VLDPASGSPAAVVRSNYAPCPCLVAWCSFSGCGRTCLWFRYGLSLGCGCRGGGPSLTPGVPIPCRRLPFGILPFSCALGCPIGRGPQSHPVVASVRSGAGRSRMGPSAPLCYAPLASPLAWSGCGVVCICAALSLCTRHCAPSRAYKSLGYFILLLFRQLFLF
jgi:hypothetical protein